MLTLYQTEWCVYSHRVRRLLTELCLDYTCVNVAPSGEDRTALKELTGQTEIPVLVDDGQVVGGSDAIVEHLRGRYPATAATPAHHKTGEFRYVRECADAPDVVLEHLRSLLAERRLYVVSETRLPFNGHPSYAPAANDPADDEHGAAAAGGDDAEIAAAAAAAAGEHGDAAAKGRDEDAAAAAGSAEDTPSPGAGSGLGPAAATSVVPTVDEAAEVVATGDYILVQVAATAVWKRIIRTDPATVGALTMRIGIWPLPDHPGCSGVSIEDPVAGAWIAGSSESIWAARQARPRIKEIFEQL